MRLNSFEEWSPLREVIVGSAVNYTSHERELSFDLFFHDNISRSDRFYARLAVPGGPTPAETADGRGLLRSLLCERFEFGGRANRADQGSATVALRRRLRDDV